MVDFYKGKRVFLTGHTGFKGSWMCGILAFLGADVYGYALAPPTNPSLFELAKTESRMHSVIGDIRDREKLALAMADARPEFVLHMAAQPLVRESYADPVLTYDTNVMGTVHVLEAVRSTPGVRSFLNVTTDKVYKNNEWVWGYRETDELNGYDPYSNSKSCSELVTDSYEKSFFQHGETAISTARAGNVIGGGDFAKDRIIPDCVRTAIKGGDILVRNPYSTRPYQHVLEPLYAYLAILMKQEENPCLAGCYNIGPADESCVTTGELATLFCDAWGGVEWTDTSEENAPHEANFLKLDCSKAKAALGVSPRLNIRQAVEMTVEWSKCYACGGDINAVMEKQIREYFDRI